MTEIDNELKKFDMVIKSLFIVGFIECILLVGIAVKIISFAQSDDNCVRSAYGKKLQTVEYLGD